MGVLVHLTGMAAAAARVIPRRMRSGPLRPGWSLQIEILAEHLRAFNRRFGKLDPLGQRAGWASLNAPSAVAGKIWREPAAIAGVPGAWFSPRTGAEDRVILYLHGGAYIYGSVDSHQELIARIALEARARVLALDYRLAPEHPFPAAIDDVVAVYRALVAGGTAPRRVLIAGDSAGGGLTAAALLTLRDAGDRLPAGGVMICPWVDVEARDGSMIENEAYDWATREDADLWQRTYLGGADPRDGRASAIHAELRGLPPLLVQVGEAEILRDQVRAFVDKARAAGVAVEFELAPGMIHDWHIFAATLPEARRSIASIGAFARRLAPAAPTLPDQGGSPPRVEPAP